jgi:hypothetical protein
MRIWGGTFLGVVACLLVGASVAVAAAGSAKHGFDVHERSLTTRLEVGASNGYEGLIATRGHKQVTLVLFKGRTAFAARTSGRVTQHGIEADFGEMGSVSVRFHPGPASRGSDAGGTAGLVSETLRRHRGNGSHCRGRHPVFEEGIFRGKIQFEGENGFARIDSRRAGGFVSRRYRQVCPHASEKGEKDFKDSFERLLGKLRYTMLQAEGTGLLFEAKAVDASALFGHKAGFGYEFSALSREHREDMRLMRVVRAAGNEGSFLFSKKGSRPQTATITPAKPFSGAAEYVKEKGAPASWTGTLSVRLPGAGLVSLAGPQFRADLCRISFIAVLDGEQCLQGGDSSRRLLADLGVERAWAAPQPRAYGSGSQSQAFWDARLSWSR